MRRNLLSLSIVTLILHFQTIHPFAMNAEIPNERTMEDPASEDSVNLKPWLERVSQVVSFCDFKSLLLSKETKSMTCFFVFGYNLSGKQNGLVFTYLMSTQP